jgi:hypothetical protein
MEKDEIIQMYLSGKTCRDIAPLAGVCYDTIHNWLGKWGVTIRRRGPRDKKYPDSKHRHWQLDIAKRYGITEAEYTALFEKQGGVCAICKKLPQKRLCVDHVHDETKRVRGLLCKSCNMAIGLLKDDPVAVLALYTYITQ